MINYNKKVFIGNNNNEVGDFTKDTVFFYKQNGDMIQAKYFGGYVKYGEMIGLVDKQGKIQVSFSHSTIRSDISGGIGTFIPEIMENDRIKLSGKWCLADGNNSEIEWRMEEYIETPFERSPPLY